MGVVQFDAVEDDVFLLEVDAVAFEEEVSQHAFQVHAFYEVGGVQGYAVEGYFVHFHVSFYQGPCLHSDVQAFEHEQGVGHAARGERVARQRTDYLHASHQQVQREAQVYPLYGYVHACCFGGYGDGLFSYHVLHGGHVEQDHQYRKQYNRGEQCPRHPFYPFSLHEAGIRKVGI